MESLVSQRLHLLGGGCPVGGGREKVGVVPLDDVVGVLLLALGQRVVPLERRRRQLLPPGGDLVVRLLLVLVDEAAAAELAAAPVRVRGGRLLIHPELVSGWWDVVVLKGGCLKLNLRMIISLTSFRTEDKFACP